MAVSLCAGKANDASQQEKYCVNLELQLAPLLISMTLILLL